MKEMIARIIDGETYGQLPKCPNCCLGQLKLDSNNPAIVVCPGYVSIYGEKNIQPNVDTGG